MSLVTVYGAAVYAPEARPGTPLYHAHVDSIERPRLLVDLSDAGTRFPRAGPSRRPSCS